MAYSIFTVGYHIFKNSLRLSLHIALYLILKLQKLQMVTSDQQGRLDFRIVSCYDVTQRVGPACKVFHKFLGMLLNWTPLNDSQKRFTISRLRVDDSRVDFAVN